VRYRYLILLSLAFASYAAMANDTPKPSSERKTVRRAPPTYPDLARKMNISGTVKLIITVAPNGTVKTVEALGGNPLLIKAAQDAVTNWKYVPATEETREVVELRFEPR
jgi:TonB family protein